MNYEELDPNIRKVVQLLRENNFDTTDSGDGSKYPEMECAEPIANVYSVVRHWSNLQTECDRMHQLLLQKVGEPIMTNEGPSWIVQGTYLPGDKIAIVELHGVTDDMLKE